jgi:hypothetical protein
MAVSKRNTRQQKTVNAEVTLPTDVVTSKVEVTPKVPAKRTVDRDEWVTLMNYTDGRVRFTSKRTGAELVFSEFGQTDEIQVQDLIAMKNAHPRYLREPWLIVLDDDVVDYLGLSEIYDNILDAYEMENFFSLPVGKMEEVLTKAPKGMVQTVVSMAIKKIENKQLDSISTIRLIEKISGIELVV